ncbi:MAG: tRNA dihydrouridine synthase DusB [Woeseiaceae bacterium]
MKIGPFRLSSPFLLAPMAGITDAPFRRLCRRFGAAMATSEMTTADLSLWRTAKSRRRLDLDLDCEPRVVQIAGSEPEMLALAAKLCADRGAQIIDINMGCPAKKVCNKLAGSSLLQNETLVASILESVVTAVDVPVTLKIRTGWDPAHRNGVAIARIAEASGIQALAVHGRTRACRFTGFAEYETIAAIKNAVGIPVIANGDITTFEKSLEVLHVTGADALMIGRGAQGRPWLFRELNDRYEKNDAKNDSKNDSIISVEKNFVRDIMLDHLGDLYQFYGETTGVRVARKHLIWYCAGLKNIQTFRTRVVRVDSAFEQIRLTREYFADVAGNIEDSSASDKSLTS